MGGTVDWRDNRAEFVKRLGWTWLAAMVHSKNPRRRRNFYKALKGYTVSEFPS